ncbi:MAG: isoprenyl transferase [Fusobacteriia bacterium 4572_132]|nr:MAG: isoprenyl transferase [Fusobacteriia bacterium 4572_132]
MGKVPNHIAIIMDGNGRWANKKGLPRIAGHKEGVKTVRKILDEAKKQGVGYLTLYAFSTENWKRSKLEVSALMKLFYEYLKKEKEELKNKNVKLVFSGRREKITKKLLKQMDETVKYLEDNDGIVLNIAFNYGGRNEIVDAVNKMLKKNITEITEEELGRNLYQPNIPDPELVIRTSNEFRISNFLLWEIAYSEFYISEKYWPEFTKEDFVEAIENYQKRDRRFGGIK